MNFKFKPRRTKCHECDKVMIQRDHRQKYHPSCRKIAQARITYESQIRTGKIKNPGYGSAGLKPRRAKCHECGNGMMQIVGNQKYHPACREIVQTRLKYEHKVRTGYTKKPGSGDAGKASHDEDHGNWIGGCPSWQVKNFRGTECERCGDGGQMHLHHRDRDRSNWKNGNLETLCIPCHQEEHRNDKGMEIYYDAA